MTARVSALVETLPIHTSPLHEHTRQIVDLGVNMGERVPVDGAMSAP